MRLIQIKPDQSQQRHLYNWLKSLNIIHSAHKKLQKLEKEPDDGTDEANVTF